jgi:hypothetical protein
MEKLMCSRSAARFLGPGVGLLLIALASMAQVSTQTSSIFLNKATYSLGNGGLIAVADVNGDGKPDFIVQSDGLSVWLGNGDGTFQPAQFYPQSGGYVPLSIAIADVNGDGKPDLLVGHYCFSVIDCSSGSVGVLLGNDDGTFRTPLSYGSGGYAADSIAVADVNGDGRPDVVVLNFCSSSSAPCLNSLVSVLLGNGDGTLQTPQNYSSGGRFAHSIAGADVNGDGKPDLLVANQCAIGAKPPGPGTVGVLLGNGDGTFLPAVNYDSGGLDAYSITVGDVNQDGKLDLLVANQCVTNSGNCTIGPGEAGVLLGNGDGTFQVARTYGSGGADAFSVVAGDVNGDGKPDLVMLNGCAGGDCANGSVLLGNGDGTFQAGVNFDVGGVADWAAVADLNGDGKLDLLTSTDQSFVKVLLNIIPQSVTTTVVTASALVNQAATFTATVDAPNGMSGSGAPGGTVTFRFQTPNASQTALVPLNQNKASYTKTFLTGGQRIVTASYSGDSNFQPSGSDPLREAVPRPTATIRASIQQPVTRDSQGNFVALVAITNAGNVIIPAVQVTIAGTALGWVELLSAPPLVTNLASGATATVALTFPSTAVPTTAATVPLRVSGTYSAPAFSLGGNWSFRFRGVGLK